MRHRWGKRSWWSRFVGSSTQTCSRCGSKLRVERPLKLLPGRRRPRAVITRWFRRKSEFSYWQIDAMPPCVARRVDCVWVS